MNEFRLFFVSTLACAFLLSCSKNQETSEEISNIGKVDYEVSEAQLSTWSHREVGGEYFLVNEIAYSAATTGLRVTLFHDGQNTTQSAMTTTSNLCHLNTQVSEVEVTEIKAWFREVELCRYRIAPGTLIPAIIAYPNGYFAGPLNGPIRFDGSVLPATQGVSICKYSQIQIIADKLLAKFDDTSIASCLDN